MNVLIDLISFLASLQHLVLKIQNSGIAEVLIQAQACSY